MPETIFKNQTTGIKTADDIRRLTNGSDASRLHQHLHVAGSLPAWMESHTTGSGDNFAFPVELDYDLLHHRLHIRTLMVTEVGDTPEIAIRRIPGDYPDTVIYTPTVATEPIGLIHFSGFDGTSITGRAAQIFVRAATDFTSSSNPGQLIFGTTSVGDTSMEDPGALMINETQDICIMQNGAKLKFMNGAESDYLRIMDVDGSNNLNIGRDDGITNIQFFGPVDFYDSNASATIGPSINPLSAGQALNMRANAIQITEMSDPGVAAANSFRLFAQDNGSGKTQFMVRFPTGVAQEIKIEA